MNDLNRKLAEYCNLRIIPEDVKKRSHLDESYEYWDENKKPIRNWYPLTNANHADMVIEQMRKNVLLLQYFNNTDEPEYVYVLYEEDLAVEKGWGKTRLEALRPIVE